MIGLFKELYEYRFMVYSLIWRDLRGRYKGSLLGFLWNFVLPLMQILVYILVFTIIFRQNIEHYYVYIIVGMVPWFMISDSLNYGSGSVVDNSQLITKIYFPRSVIPVSIILSKFVNFLISMIFVFLLLIIGGHGVDIAILTTPLAMICLLFFSLGLAMILAAANVYMRDVQYMVSVVLMMLIWMTPIMYVRGYVDNEFFQLILSINPFTYLIEFFQDTLYWKIVPAIDTILIVVSESLVMLFLGAYIYNKLSVNFAEVL